MHTVTKSMKFCRLLLNQVKDRLTCFQARSKPTSWPKLIIGCRPGLVAVKLLPAAKLRYIWFMPGAAKLR